MTRSIVVDSAISGYAAAHSKPLSATQAALAAATAAQTGDAAQMQIGADQAAFTHLLVAALRPRFAVEIGTFTGMSALAIAGAMPADGQLLCCDTSEEWTAIARTHWKLAGVDHKIELAIAPARETLATIDERPPVDFAFIDADKESYVVYYEQLVPRLSERGVILVDNTLWSGNVLDDTIDDSSTTALRDFNQHVAADPRTDVALLTIGDGVTMITVAASEA